MARLRDLVLDVQVAENCGLKYMYYNTYRPNVAKSIRLPFFGKCKVDKIAYIHGRKEWKLTVKVEINKAKSAIVQMSNHVASLSKNKTSVLSIE